MKNWFFSIPSLVFIGPVNYFTHFQSKIFWFHILMPQCFKNQIFPPQKKFAWKYPICFIFPMQITLYFSKHLCFFSFVFAHIFQQLEKPPTSLHIKLIYLLWNQFKYDVFWKIFPHPHYIIFIPCLGHLLLLLWTADTCLYVY